MGGRIAIFLLTALPVFPVQAQKFSLAQSTVTFFSDAAIEDITATNSKTTSLWNVSTGEIVFSVPIKEFEFEKSLMRTHFNEKYMESDKYPRALFQGKIAGIKMDVREPQLVKAQGKITIHGVTREIEVPGTIQVKEGEIIAKAKFIVKLQDYKIKIPQLLWQNIAEEVEVTVDFLYKPS
jgi:hypothetical protein